MPLFPLFASETWGMCPTDRANTRALQRRRCADLWSCRNVNVFAFDALRGFLTTVISNLPASTAMVVLPHCRTVRSTLCVCCHRTPDFVTLRAMIGPFRLLTPSPDTILMRCHACACCTTIGKGQVRHVWRQHQAPITASLHSGSPDFYVAGFFFFGTLS